MSNIKGITNVVSREFKGSDKGHKEATDKPRRVDVFVVPSYWIFF